MYILLHLKEEYLLSDVVTLLFSNGHRAFSVAETIEDLCPTCDISPKTTAPFNAENKRKRANPGKRSRTSAYSVQQQATAAHNRSRQQHDTTVDDSPCSSRLDANLSGSNNGFIAEEIVQTTIDEDMERSRLKESVMVDVEADADNEEFKFSSALKMLGQQCGGSSGGAESGSGGEEIVISTETMGMTKRRQRVEELGLEIYQCQLCKKCITRQGQYANLMNHLSRHARLHASRKQYSCPLCNQSYTRRYLAAAHIKEAHPGEQNFCHPMDYAEELKEEYRSLLDVCFPGMENRRRSQTAAHSGEQRAEGGADAMVEVERIREPSTPAEHPQRRQRKQKHHQQEQEGGGEEGEEEEEAEGDGNVQQQAQPLPLPPVIQWYQERQRAKQHREEEEAEEA